ncbi:Rieske (2Fe-2S) protein [Sphingomonas sp.]|uniref:Rieske (2Fe-2S) protein n=1 Tax=Sphingomonas sp. TaxID=28214 RepID=UPI001EB38A15|nr:Rieske (2Fe-2S) protein [Sphingomonas sp.]MBX3594687.1 Rieske (2Fe-2S) protein [Sphingomonas sp.]
MTDRLTATPPGIRLGPVDLIADGAARNFVIEMKAGRFHGFAVRSGDGVRGFVDRCPHMGLPLAQQLDDYLTDDGTLIRCSWHGALFRTNDGACVGGPCAGACLTPWPIALRDGAIWTA